MLTLSNLFVTTITDLSTLSGTYTAFAEYRYGNICTNFNHDGTSQSFTGKVLATGGVWEVVRSSGSLLTESSVTDAPPLTLTVGNGVFAPVNSQVGTAACQITGGLSPLPGISTLGTDPVTSITVLGSMFMELSGDTVTGSVGATFTAFRCGLDTLPSQFAPFSLTRGGGCGV